LGATRCNVERVGLVLSGAATAAFDDGRVVELRAGELFYIPPVPHDSWVIGDQPYVSLHFLGADHYTKVGAIDHNRPCCAQPTHLFLNPGRSRQLRMAILRLA